MTVSERQLRGLGWSLYLTALLFAASPAFEILAAAYPFHPSLPTWRLAVLGLLSQSLPVPVFGLLLALAAAVLLKQRAAQTAVSVLCGAGAVVLVVGWVSFALDALQLRKSVRPQALAGFDMTVSRSALILLYGVVVLVVLAVLGMRGRGAAPKDSEPATLIAGRRSQETH